MRPFAILLFILLIPFRSALAAETEPAKPAKPAAVVLAPSALTLEIIDVQKGYVEAFNKGDAKAVAALFTADADWIDDRGTVIRGQAAIQRAVEDSVSEHKGKSLKLRMDSVRVLAPDVVVGNALSTFNEADKSGESSAFIAVYVKQDGKWRITLLTETSEVEEDE